MVRAWTQCDEVEQHCLDNFGNHHPDIELEGSTGSVVQFEGVLPEASGVAYEPVGRLP